MAAVARSIEKSLGDERGYIHSKGNSVQAVSVKQVIVHCPAAAENTHTLAVDLVKYNISKVYAVRGIRHTTANSVLVLEAPTTSVSGSTLTITLGGSGAGKRSYLIIGE